tara:strand:+ start:2818 stop:3324 length:507 start_codon:yes stop_codon:yes gene_type:complete
MNELINKISSYNLFNYLFPGILFVVLLHETTNINLIQDNVFEGAFMYYFIGLLINRVGSLCIEPFLLKIKFVKFQPYKEFKQAVLLDPKIDILSETNNMLRSITALFLLLGIFIVMNWAGIQVHLNSDYAKVLVVSLIFVFLVLSYRKQTKFIYKCVEDVLSNQKDKA